MPQTYYIHNFEEEVARACSGDLRLVEKHQKRIITMAEDLIILEGGDFLMFTEVAPDFEIIVDMTHRNKICSQRKH